MHAAYHADTMKSRKAETMAIFKNNMADVLREKARRRSGEPIIIP